MQGMHCIFKNLYRAPNGNLVNLGNSLTGNYAVQNPEKMELVSF